MSVTECSACHAPLTGQGRFCGTCGAAVAQAQPAVDPLGRVSVPQPRVQAPVRHLGPTLENLGIPVAARPVSGRSQVAVREMDWLEGAVVALIGLLPVILVGVALFATQRDSGMSLLGWIGDSASLAYGGGVDLNGERSSAVAEEVFSLRLTSYNFTVALISGLLLFAGSRRVLRRANTCDLGSCLRRVTPVTALFIAGAVILSALASGATVSIEGASFTVSSSLLSVFFMGALVAAFAVGIAVVSRARVANPTLDLAWTTLSAPVFAVTALVLLVGSLAVLGGSLWVVAMSGWDWESLVLVPVGGGIFVEVALSAIALGTMSSLSFSVDSGAVAIIQQLTRNAPERPTLDNFDVWTIFGESAWLGALILTVVNAVGIIAAATMILRRKDASVARRDLGVWVMSFFGLGLVMVIFVRFGADMAAQVTTIAGSASETGIVSAGISASVLFLLPVFAVAWWFLARLILPRLPASTLMRLSDWARSGL